MTVSRTQIFQLLKSLPLIRFALMLGGGIMATISAGHVQWWMARSAGFPDAEAIWLARINAMLWLGVGSLGLVALVMVALTFGRAGRVGVKAAGVEVDVDFDNSSGDPQ